MGDSGSLPDNCDLIAIGEHFIKLVRNEDDRCAFGDESLERGEQLINFLRD